MCDLFLFVGVRMAIWLLKSHEPVRGVAVLLPLSDLSYRLA